MSNNVVVGTAALTNALDYIQANDGFLKLFTNDYTPVAGMDPGDFTEAVGGGYAHKWVKGVTTPAAGQIEGMTRAAACVVTWTTHGMTTGDKVTFASIAQASWTALNGNEYAITYINANSFSIAVNTSGYAGDYVPGTDPGTIVETTPCAWTEEYANTPPDIIMAEQTFTFSGVLTTNPTVYGWYLIKQDLSEVYAAKRLDTEYTPASGGGTLKFTPRVQAGNGTPT